MIAGRLSFRARVTAWYVGFVALLLIGLSLSVYFIVRGALNSSLNDQLDQHRSRSLATIVVINDTPRFAGPPPVLADDDDAFARLFDTAGRLIDPGSPLGDRLPPAADRIAAALTGESGRYDTPGPQEKFRTIILPISGDGRIVGALEAGIDRSDTDEALSALLFVLLIAVPVTILVAGIGGLILARRALRPLAEMTAMARTMSADALHERLHFQGPRDELGQLADTLDSMLERLEAAFRRQQQFTGYAAHELRTPLTAIRGQVDVALQRARSPEEYRETLRRVGDQTTRLTDLVTSLLTLARADADALAVARETVNLPALVRESLEAHAADAGRLRFDLRSVMPDVLDVSADPYLLRQLLHNLLRNALAVMPHGGAITVEAEKRDGAIGLAVADTGPALPPEDLERLFDRFHRPESARTRSSGGAGLGLAICRSIAEAHGGSIRAENLSRGGARFTVYLPDSPA